MLVPLHELTGNSARQQTSAFATIGVSAWTRAPRRRNICKNPPTQQSEHLGQTNSFRITPYPIGLFVPTKVPNHERAKEQRFGPFHWESSLPRLLRCAFR